MLARESSKKISRRVAEIRRLRVDLKVTKGVTGFLNDRKVLLPMNGCQNQRTNIEKTGQVGRKLDTVDGKLHYLDGRASRVPSVSRREEIIAAAAMQHVGLSLRK